MAKSLMSCFLTDGVELLKDKCVDRKTTASMQLLNLGARDAYL